MTSVGHSFFPSMSQRVSKSGITLLSLASNRCSFPRQMEKTVIGPDDVVALRPEDHHGQGEFTMVSLVATSMFPVTFSMYLAISRRRRRLFSR